MIPASPLRIDLADLLEALCPLPEGVTVTKPTEALWLERVPEDGAERSVALSLPLKTENGPVELCGRADLVCRSPAGYIVEEAVCLERGLEEAAVREAHLLRARLLALALCRQKDLSEVTVRWAVWAEGRWALETFSFSQEALRESLRPVAAKIQILSGLWLRQEGGVAFPHASLRPGQKEFIRAVWNAVKSGSSLMACAPTGIGKTLAAFYPALKALEKGLVPQVYYASPKNTLKMQAAAAVESLQPKRLLRVLVLSAKMALCPRRAEECEREGCAFAEGFYSRVSDAICYLSSFSCVTSKELGEAADRFCVCPFDLALRMQKYCQVVIGDYNHVFDPENAPFAPKKGSVLLVDEAHNIPARERETYSQALTREQFDCFFQSDSPAFVMLRAHFADLLAAFADLEKKRRDAKTYFSFSLPEDFVKAVDELLPKVRFALAGGFGQPEEKDARLLRALWRDLTKFSRLAKLFSDQFAVLYPPAGGVALYLVDPREICRAVKKRWRSIVYFSATLLPRDYYFDLLGGEESDSFLVLPSPFPRDNFFVGLCDVDVSFSRRFESAPKICSIIHTAASVRPGHTMVFLPSFEYLDLIVQEYKKAYYHDRILVQKKEMRSRDRAAFLQAFCEKTDEMLIGFCVLGGIFSEGIDLKGDALLGEVIVGTGFPPPSPEAEAQSASYYKREMDGKSFAYTLPGWSRVLQAAGRVIRDENDRGFLIVCDTRCCTEEIRELFPESWEGAEVIERESVLKQKLERFWQ